MGGWAAAVWRPGVCRRGCPVLRWERPPCSGVSCLPSQTLSCGFWTFRGGPLGPLPEAGDPLLSFPAPPRLRECSVNFRASLEFLGRQWSGASGKVLAEGKRRRSPQIGLHPASQSAEGEGSGRPTGSRNPSEEKSLSPEISAEHLGWGLGLEEGTGFGASGGLWLFLTLSLAGSKAWIK